MKYSRFNEQSFRAAVGKAVQDAKTILGTAKNPRLAADDPDHTYEDKYALADHLTNSSIAALLQVLDRLGLDASKLPTLLQWAQDDQRTVTLSFRAEESCTFLEETVAELPSGHRVVESSVTETTNAETTSQDETATSPATSKTTATTKSFEVIRKVKQHHWKVDVHYAVAVYPGNDTSAAVQLQARNTSTRITTSGGTVGVGQPVRDPIPPVPQKHKVHPPVEVDLTWLLQQLNREAGVCQFAIDRTAEACKTPLRNPDIQKAVEFNGNLRVWANAVGHFFVHHVDQDIRAKHQPAVPQQGDNNNKPALGAGADTAGRVFCPIAPLMENGSVLESEDTRKVLEAHSQSVNASFADLAKLFPAPSAADTELATTAEAVLVLLCHHTVRLVNQYTHSVHYIEHMLYTQLVQAIGKAVKSSDFDAFMRFHNQRLFEAPYRPKPFVYAIRRPNHYPDGILSIEPTHHNHSGGVGNNEDLSSIETTVRHMPGGTSSSPIYLPINAATSLEITGDRYLHGWVQHRFASEAVPKFQIAARARQFSSFLLVLGNMANKDTFAPKSAVILQNKDEVLIPLLTDVLPTAKEFKDAISSLSPEQQEFAKAYRAMQLESSVFGVCVIQLKPQMEKLLGLPADSLTKEIKLTQDLMSLFVDYQIPSDLLSFAGDAETATAQKLEAVKGHVKSVLDVVEATKGEQLLEEQQKKEMRKAQHTGPEAVMFAAPTMAGGGLFGAAAPAYSPELGAPAPSGGFGAMAPAPDQMMMSLATCDFDEGPLADWDDGLGSPKKSQPEKRSASRGGRGGNGLRAKKSAAVSSAAAPPPPSTPLGTAKEAEPRAMDTEAPQSNNNNDADAGDVEFEEADDFTLVPKILDARVEKFDNDNALKSTILKTGPEWIRTRQQNLLAKRQKASLGTEEQTHEKNKAFDLLDALSRSGTLSIECSELHVIVCLSHCFENDVMGTLVQDNINPIAKAERSSLIVGSVIHDEPCPMLVQVDSNAKRLGASFPALFADED